MTQQTEQAQQLAYAVFYEAYRNGANRKHYIVFQANEPIISGEQLSGLSQQVGRTAVANGQANSIDDVCITSVSLLNQQQAAPEQLHDREQTKPEKAFIDFWYELDLLIQGCDDKHNPTVEAIQSAIYGKQHLISMFDVPEGQRYQEPERCGVEPKYVDRLEKDFVLLYNLVNTQVEGFIFPSRCEETFNSLQE